MPDILSDILRLRDELMPRQVQGHYFTVCRADYTWVYRQQEQVYANSALMVQLAKSIIHVDDRVPRGQVFLSDEPIAEGVGSVHEPGSPEWEAERARRQQLFTSALAQYYLKQGEPNGEAPRLDG